MSELDLGAPDLPPDLRFTDAPPPSGAMDQLSAFGNALHASYEAQRFDGDMFAKANALSEAIDLRNAHIQRETGEALENPLEGGYLKEAAGRAPFGQLTPAKDGPLAIYQEKLDALQQQYPQKAAYIRADVPVMADARQLSDYWAQRAAKGEPGLNAVAGLAAGFIGGAAGFFRNPGNTLLALGTGGSSAEASLATVLAREAAVNAGLQAVAEPGVQSWRAERGQESGVVPALKEIGEAGLFGAGFGAVLHIGGRMLSQAVDHGEGVSQILPEKPPPAPPASPAAETQAHVDNLGPAARAEAESGKVAPEVALETAKRVDGDAAQLATMRGAQAEMDATGARGTDAAAEAVSREMEAQTTPQALAAIHGLDEAVPAVPEPRFRREGERAAEAQSEALQAELQTEVEATPHPSPLPQGEREPGAGPIEDVTITPKRAVTRKYLSLFEALSDKGLAPSGDLKAIFDGNPFVPGFGRLVRAGGRTLDEAAQYAREIGYLHDPNFVEGAGPVKLGINDLLDLLRDEAHGSRVYTFEDSVKRAEEAAKREGADYEKAYKKNLKAVDKEFAGERFYDDVPELKDRAARAMSEDETLSPAHAMDRAFQDWERDLLSRSDQFEEVHNARLEKYGVNPNWDEINAKARAEFFADDEAAPRAGGEASGAGEGASGARENPEIGAGPRGAGEREGPPLRLLDLTPFQDSEGRHLSLEEALAEPTKAEMLAKVVERCPS